MRAVFTYERRPDGRMALAIRERSGSASILFTAEDWQELCRSLVAESARHHRQSRKDGGGKAA